MTDASDPFSEFEQWYEHDMPRLFNYLSYRVRDRAAAEDLTAAICEKAVQNLHRFDPARSDLAGWIFGIARNELLHHLRAHRRHPTNISLDSLPDMVASGDSVEEQANRLALTREAMRHLGDLPEQEQELVALRYGADLNSDQIATMMGLTAGNVRVKLHRALEKIRELLISNEEVANA